MGNIIDDYIGFQNKSDFEIAITLTIFELEHRSKPQRVTSTHDNPSSIFNFGIASGKNVSRQLKIAAVLKIPKYEAGLQFDNSQFSQYTISLLSPNIQVIWYTT